MKNKINENSTKKTGKFLSFKEARKEARNIAYETGFWGYVYHHKDGSYSALSYKVKNKNWQFIGAIKKDGSFEDLTKFRK